jgi:PAS domain S-box-containing protein
MVSGHNGHNNGTAASAPVLEIRNIHCDYGDIRALRGIDLEIYPGEVHALIGEHGAGKSTLASVLSGFARPRSGHILVEGRLQNNFSLPTAKRLQIHMVYQQPQINEKVTVAENIFYMQKHEGRVPWYSRRKTEHEAEEYLQRRGFELDPRTRARYLSPSDKTVVDILKNILEPPRILILDEALERLSNESLGRITTILEDLRDTGTAIVIVTHRIDDVYTFADKVTVLKEGVRLLTTSIDNISKINLIRVAYTQFEVEHTPAQADQEFRQYLRFNDAILQRLPVNIIVVDPQLEVKLVNESCRRNFRLTDTPVSGLVLRDILHGDDSNIASVEAAITAERNQAFYDIALEVNGERHVYNVKTSSIRDDAVVIGTVVIIEDVTEYNELQNQLIMSEKLASVGLLAAGVAHEINNPLEIISNHLSYMKYKRGDADVVAEGADKIKTEIEDISEIVSNLVTFSDAKTPQVEAVDLNKIILDLLSLLRYNVEYRHTDISFQREAPELHFWGLRDQMKQVILNLIKNSLEAMPEGGSIFIRTRIDDTTAVLEFEDTGPGIDAADPNAVFTPFFSTKTDRPSSMGLGLSISYRTVNRIGGTMRVENLPDRGCRFIIRLPLALDP